MDLLECPVCLDTYQDPVLLPSCGHTFCRRCIQQIAASSNQSGSSWTAGAQAQHRCPTCRAPFRQGDARQNYALQHLLADRSEGRRAPSQNLPQAQSGTDTLRRGVTRDLNIPLTSQRGPDLERIQRLQSFGVPYGLAKLLQDEDQQIGKRIFLLDNSGSTNTCDGHHFEQLPDGTMRSWPCTRWEEIKHMAIEHAHWNGAVGTPCEFVLLNPGPGPLQEGRDFLRLDWSAPGQEAMAIDSLRRMLDASGPQGVTPMADRLNEIYARIHRDHEELVRRGQRVVLVVATDGLPTSSYSGHSSDADKRAMTNILTRLMTELSVSVVIRLTTDDDEVVGYYNDIDENLELPMDIVDDIESEAKEIRGRGNGWLPYSPLLHRIREGGTFVKLFDLLDERRLTPTEVSIFSQLLLRNEGDAPLPRSAEDFCAALEEAVDDAPSVYDPLRRRMVPPIDVGQVGWVVMPASSRMAATMRLVAGTLISPFGQCYAPSPSYGQTNLVF